FVVEGGGPGDGAVDAVDFDGGVLEIVAHAGDAPGADAVDVAVVGLVFGKVAIDKALGDVEDDAIFEGAVALHPPGVLVIPHANALGVPGFVFGAGVPAGDVDVMHPAVVEWRAFGLVAFGGHVAGG